MPTDEQYVPGQLYMINLNDLLPDSEQPRKYLEAAAISKTLSLNRLPKEVLDECRKDPSMPKSALIAIAQKKQERSMRHLIERR